MSEVMDEEIKRWTARRKSALVLEIIQGRTTVSEASRQFDLSPSEIEGWVEDGKGLVVALELHEHSRVSARTKITLGRKSDRVVPRQLLEMLRTHIPGFDQEKYAFEIAWTP